MSAKIRHIVILYFKKDKQQDYFKLLEATKPFIAEIPGILSYKIYKNQSKYTPANVFSLGVEIIFENKGALDVFMNHPKHYEANALFENYLAQPPFAVLTYELEDNHETLIY